VSAQLHSPAVLPWEEIAIVAIGQEAGYIHRSVVPKVGGTTPWGAVGLLRWALIGSRGGREHCYNHRGVLVDK
jgi:hypothetical protein